jgi:hypothetical protein
MKNKLIQNYKFKKKENKWILWRNQKTRIVKLWDFITRNKETKEKKWEKMHTAITNTRRTVTLYLKNV